MFRFWPLKRALYFWRHQIAPKKKCNVLIPKTARKTRDLAWSIVRCLPRSRRVVPFSSVSYLCMHEALILFLVIVWPVKVKRPCRNRLLRLINTCGVRRFTSLQLMTWESGWKWRIQTFHIKMAEGAIISTERAGIGASCYAAPYLASDSLLARNGINHYLHWRKWPLISSNATFMLVRIPT